MARGDFKLSSLTITHGVHSRQFLSIRPRHVSLSLVSLSLCLVSKNMEHNFQDKRTVSIFCRTSIGDGDKRERGSGVQRAPASTKPKFLERRLVLCITHNGSTVSCLRPPRGMDDTPLACVPQAVPFVLSARTFSLSQTISVQKRHNKTSSAHLSFEPRALLNEPNRLPAISSPSPALPTPPLHESSLPAPALPAGLVCESAAHRP